MLTPVLHNAVWALWSTVTHVVALINGYSRWQADSLFGVVCKLGSSIAATTRRLFLVAVCAFTSNNRILLNYDALARHVVVDIDEIL